MRVIFIRSDGKIKRNKKRESKRLTFINKGFEQINTKLGHPRYRTIEEVEKRISTLLLNIIYDCHKLIRLKGSEI